MTEVEIPTPRGAVLAGTYVNPVDSTNAAVIFSHSFLSDRDSGLHFTRLAAMYRGLGYATLQFDYSGHGQSSDEPITLESFMEDLRAASGWLADQGFTRQLLHAHSFGTLPPLRARPPAVKAMILSSAIMGPLSYDWEQIFSPDQLEELEKTGVMRIVDDTPGPREFFEVSNQTLRDISLSDSSGALTDLEYPLLLIHDVEDEQQGLLQMTMDIFPLLPSGSKVEVLNEDSFAGDEKMAHLHTVAADWATVHLPVR